MKVEVRVTNEFKRNAKWLIKKYPSLKNQLNELESDLFHNPRMGTRIFENVYKIRLGVKSKGKGKRGGLRIITYVEVIEKDNFTFVFLIAIYDKSDIENISDSEILERIKDL
ncbi:MAG: hypothetical protein SFU98_22050 [Leptospiraceae bacterium]|nr:hypothetical protein [Leptospiraceae bacterium]